jgi:hypothetical protein
MVPNAETAALLKGILEMTVGCSSLTSCPCSLQIKGTLASFLVSFGGLSVLGQSMSMLRGCGISFRQLAVMKLSHGIISGILTFAISGFVL